jgi:hypothetical protein
MDEMAYNRATMTIPEFHAALKAQGVAKDDLAFRCPACDTIQSARDLIAAKAGPDFDAVEKFIGFSCVGRFKPEAERGKKGEGKGCDWTLGGLFQIHTLEVVDDEGNHHARFAIASPKDARMHAAKLASLK